MKKLLLLLILFPAIAGAQTLTFPAESTNNTFTGTNVFSGPIATALSQFTVGTLPTASTTNPTREIVVVTDGQSAADCTVGGGSTPALCRTNGTSWVALGGLFAGSLANTQIAFGSAANTISGSNNLEYVPASGGVVITTSNVGPTNVPGAGIAMVNTGGGTTAYITKDSNGALKIQNDSNATASHGLLLWDGNSVMQLFGGQNAPYLSEYTGASVSPFGSGSAIEHIFSTGSGTHVFAAQADGALGDKGYVSLDPFNGCMTIGGDSTGNAAICVGPTAGTPNAINLPTTTGTVHYCLQTDGGSPQQTSWGQCVLVASLVTTAATTDNVAVSGMTSSGHCSLTPTNAAASGLAAIPYVSAKTTNQITVTHSVTANANFDIMCTPY